MRIAVKTPPRVLQILAVVLVGWWAFAFRFATPDFRNDSFDHLSKARQVLFGELPERDFYDDGRPLTIYVSSVLQRISPTLLPELILGAGAIAVAVVFVYLLARALARSTLLGLLAALLTMAMRPRLYNYPKVLLFPLGLWLLWRYIDRPSGTRPAQLAVLSVAAFLFRHDYGVYLGLACMCTLIAVHRRQALTPLVRYVVLGMVCCAPYLIWLGVQGRLLAAGSGGFASMVRRVPGIIRAPVHLDLSRGLFYLTPLEARVGIRWAADVGPESREALERQHGLHLIDLQSDGRSGRYLMDDPSSDRIRRILNDESIEDTSGIDREHGVRFETGWERWRRLIPLLRLTPATVFRGAADAQGWIYYVFVLSVPLALLVLWLNPGHGVAHEQVKVLSLVVLCVVLHQFLLQGERGIDLDARLPEVTGPTSVLLAWLVRRAVDAGRSISAIWSWSVRTATAGLLAVLTLVTWLGVAAYAETSITAVLTAGVVRPAALANVARDVHRRPLDYWTADGDEGLAGLTRYVARCLPPDDRLLVVSYAPEVFYLSERLFAGGVNSFVLNGFNPTSAQILARLRQQSVPLVIIDEDYRPSFERGWPELRLYIASRYREVAIAGSDDTGRFHVLVDSERAPAATEPRWGLPCFADR